MTSFSFSEVKEVGFVILLAHLLPKIYIRPLHKELEVNEVDGPEEEVSVSFHFCARQI